MIKQQTILKNVLIYEKRQWDEYYTTNVCVELKKALFNADAVLICRTIIGSYAVLIPSNHLHARQLQGPAKFGGQRSES